MSQEIVPPKAVPVSTAAPVWDPETLRQEVARLLDMDLRPEHDDVNLFELGLHSMQLMVLTNKLNRAGARVDFRRLSEEPRLSAWYALLANTAAGAPAPEPADRRAARDGVLDTGEAFALTAVQQAYWIGRSDDQALGGVGCHAYLEIDARDVDAGRLERAVRALLDLHPMLRARFEADGTQRVLARSPWPGLTVHDFGGLSAEAAAPALEELRGRLSHRRLDVGAGEVLDLQLSRLPGAGHRLHLNVDLLVADVHSIRLLLADLAALYEDPTSVSGPAYTFQRYLAERAETRRSERETARAYWQRRLPELPGGPRLPLAVEPAALPVTRFVRRTHELAPGEWRALRQRAARAGVTPAVLLATAFSEVLARFSGEDRFLLNLPLFDRDLEAHPQIGRIVADFTSLVLLEVDLTRGDDFAERARAVQRQLHEDVAHAAYTGVDVLRDFVRADGDAPRSAPVVFACNLDAPLVPDACAARFGELTWMLSQTPQVWLDHQVYATRDGGLLLAWDTVDDLFPAEMPAAMMTAYTTLLRDLAGDGPVEVDLALPVAQRRRRDEVNSEVREHSGRLLHMAFFERAGQRAAEPALLWQDDGRLTHGELAERALRIAGSLARRGVGPGTSVVVTAPKGPDQIAAVLGVLAAGAAYVPVGVDQPAARRTRILELSGARLVLDGTGLPRSPGGAAEVLTLDEALAGEPLDAPVPAAPDDTSYVIFTSGSTGTPKGVEVSHRAAVNTVEDIDERFGIGAGDRVLAVSALDFDLSVWDIFGLLSEGGALVLVDESDRRDASRWLALCARHGVTVWNSVPALLDMALTAADGNALPASLRLALLSGDWIGLDLPGRLDAATHGRCRLVGLGGATEAAIWSNAYEVTEVPAHWVSVPYGKPLRNQRFRVVDGRGRECPDWVPGELWIGGDGVALGYRGDAALTTERFPVVAGERWYRTGDLGRYWPDGNLEFLGRLDHQVKINGFRVELGEIEAALQSHPEVSSAVVVTVGDRRRELVAAVVERAPHDAGQDSGAEDAGPSPHADSGPAPEADPLEQGLVEAVLAEVIAPLVTPATAPAGTLPVRAEQRPVLDAWLDRLARQEVVRRDGAAVRPGARWAEVRAPGRFGELRERTAGSHLEPVANALAWAAPMLTAVLTGEAHASVLLDDPVLSPEGLADAMPATRDCLAAIAAALRADAADAAQPLTVGEWDAMSGLGAGRLLAALPPGSVDYTLLGSSPTLLAAADARLADSGHRVRTVHQGGAALPAAHLHAYDAVVAANVLHRMPSPETAAATMALLLRPGGRLHVLERTHLTPLALLIALPLEAEAGRLRPGGPGGSWLRSGQRWARACVAAGLVNARVERAEATGEVLLTAERPRTARGADVEDLRRWLADRVPAHMVPGHFAALPVLPLSANGKVDRRALQSLLAALTDSPRESAEPPRGAMEQTVADLWTKLLPVASVGRDENFFALGGDSLLATRLVTEVHRALGVELPMRDVMRAPTVAALGALIEGLLGAAQDREPGDEALAGDFEEGVL
ncbi:MULTISPECIES: non-ribosomal peptide synthetase [Streptomyces]|uniref:non-ribosomal peptide synthetase n=4 Tax=Streptomyces scabiei TaxID=1930 RepID=UPI0004E7A8A0|nr:MULTISPECIES: non-ribosomal peptide synthetase [Streptomyces]MBP5859185.1 non-ribosomal peptide synthetase [Streptomyces sp. LBUM 1484]MBP5934291.1 non-ribosomal peptide synthetase [Streptomyces sp. LBUM 1479]KFG09885.1 peptide synthetase [Streptomyces scabiei]MBP5904560.1 non-ribosomal peptide synthetase [Streptomyces sp. LBUM 1488]MBP5918892.1 non-ribosomal peptide synthetase [Streptomyces sp. LBUM 1483]